MALVYLTDGSYSFFELSKVRKRYIQRPRGDAQDPAVRRQMAAAHESRSAAVNAEPIPAYYRDVLYYTENGHWVLRGGWDYYREIPDRAAEWWLYTNKYVKEPPNFAQRL